MKKWNSFTEASPTINQAYFLMDSETKYLKALEAMSKTLKREVLKKQVKQLFGGAALFDSLKKKLNRINDQVPIFVYDEESEKFISEDQKPQTYGKLYVVLFYDRSIK